MNDRGRLNEVLRLVEREAEAYLGAIDTAHVRPPGVEQPEAGLPSDGVGSLQAVSELIAASLEGATRSTGPRYFHYVTGGGTPAAPPRDRPAAAPGPHPANPRGPPSSSPPPT